MPESVRIQLFGGLQVTCDGLSVSQFETRKTAALVAYLALHPTRSHSRDELAERLWPDEDPEATRSRLRQALAALRRGLGEACEILISDRGPVSLDARCCEIDVASFEALLRNAASESDPIARCKNLEAAVALYKGELLPGFSEEWIVSERERLTDAFAAALLDLARAFAGCGSIQKAIEFARRSVRVDPLREESHLELIRLLSTAGQRAEAARHYRGFEKIMRLELDVGPSATLEELLDQGQANPPPANSGPPVLPAIPPPSEPLLSKRLPVRGRRWWIAASGIVLLAVAGASYWGRSADGNHPDSAPSANVDRPDRPQTESLCTEGRSFWNERTESGFWEAIKYFKKAAEADPKYAPAYSGIADSYSLLGYYGYIPPDDAYRNAREAAEKAIEFSRDDKRARAEALTSRGWYRMMHDWAWLEALNDFTKALSLDPNYATAHQWRSLRLLIRKQFRMSIEEIRSAIKGEPMSSVIAKSLGQRYYHAPGRMKDAIVHLEDALKENRASGLTHYWLALAYTQDYQYAKAEKSFKQALELSGQNALMRSGLGYLYTRWPGHQTKANIILEDLLAQQRAGRYVSAYYLATLYSGLGETENAITWLKKAQSERSCELPLLNVEPRLRNVSAHPHFLKIVRQMGLN